MSAFVLKVIATACMLIDHIGALFPSPETAWMRWVGRIAFPIYVYMIAQGCLYTKNIHKYLFRLALFALIAEVPYDLAFHSGINVGVFQPQIDFLSGTNVFYTLFLGAVCIAIFRELQKKQKLWLTILALVPALPLSLAAGWLGTDYGTMGVLFIFVIYLVGPKNRLLRSAAVLVGVVCLYGLGALDARPETSQFYLPLFLFSLIAVLLVYFYNNKPGPRLKWAFYAFYPVHLAALVGVWLLLARVSY